MKLAIAGKGGVGKTSITAILVRLFHRDGYAVIAIDADSDASLAATLGFPNPRGITPIIEMKSLIEERTGARPGSLGAYFKLNPRVDDIPDRYCVDHEGIKLIVMGELRAGGTGCFCPENVFLKTLMQHLLLRRSEVVILDMEPGIEHLGRGTAAAVDALIIIVEPGRRSLETAHKIREIAGDIDVKPVLVVGNKLRHESDEQWIAAQISDTDMKIAGFVSYSELIRQADIENKSIFGSDPKIVNEIERIKNSLLEILPRRK